MAGMRHYSSNRAVMSVVLICAAPVTCADVPYTGSSAGSIRNRCELRSVQVSV
jgi:hypothetical protein